MNTIPTTDPYSSNTRCVPWSLEYSTDFFPMLSFDGPITVEGRHNPLLWLDLPRCHPSLGWNTMKICDNESHSMLLMSVLTDLRPGRL